MSTILAFTYAIEMNPGKFVMRSLHNWLNKLKNKLIRIYNSPFSIILWFSIAILILIGVIIIIHISTSDINNNGGIVQNIYPEIYGLLFDVILFGIIISIHDISKKRKRSIETEEDQIDDFRGWNSNEASHRILGSIKRLQRLNVYKVNLSNCYFKEIALRDLCFSESKMTGLIFLITEIYNVQFHSTKSNKITCHGSTISGCVFQYGKIFFNLHTTNISSTLFKDINLTSSSFFATELSFIFFDTVDFSHSYFKFTKCQFVEFKGCIFDECIVNENFFDVISDKENKNIGYQDIIQQYELVFEISPRTGNNNPVWILRNRAKVKAQRPIHRIEIEDTVSIIDPWIRAGRCQPNFDSNQEIDGH